MSYNVTLSREVLSIVNQDGTEEFHIPISKSLSREEGTTYMWYENPSIRIELFGMNVAEDEEAEDEEEEVGDGSREIRVTVAGMTVVKTFPEDTVEEVISLLNGHISANKPGGKRKTRKQRRH